MNMCTCCTPSTRPFLPVSTRRWNSSRNVFQEKFSHLNGGRISQRASFHLVCEVFSSKYQEFNLKCYQVHHPLKMHHRRVWQMKFILVVHIRVHLTTFNEGCHIFCTFLATNTSLLFQRMSLKYPWGTHVPILYIPRHHYFPFILENITEIPMCQGPS